MLSGALGIRAPARLLFGLFLVVIVQDGLLLQAALAQARSSGGYSRPSAGGSSSYSRRPSTYGGGGGGYARPSAPSYGYSGGSAGDRSVSRQGSSRAMQDYRNSQRRPSPSYGWGGAAQPPPQVNRRPSPSYGWGSWGAPSGSTITNTLLLWTLLNSLSRPGNADYFRNNQNDPTYRQWRQEAEQRAATDPAVADKLRELDAQLAAPPPTPSAPSGGGSGLLWLVLFVGGGVLVLLWVARRRAASRGGGAIGGGSAVSPATAGLRVGMTFTLDPTPFVLAGGVTKVHPPPGGTTSAEAVSTLQDGRAVLYRLYFPGRQSFMQIHAGAGGALDECRYFSQIDEVTPADAQEWGFWLDPVEGMIGWPAFQTKDGKTYGRTWLPGASRTAPRAMQEELQALGGATRRSLQMMLYSAPTETAPPAPATEYVLVAAVQDAGQAWVEIHVGIDVNPAALSLPSVPLEPDRRSA